MEFATTGDSRRQLALGREGWRAICAGDPRELANLAAQRQRALPRLSAALHRLLQELPSARCGLSHTQLRLLAMLSLQPPERGQMQARLVGAVMRTDPLPGTARPAHRRSAAGACGRRSDRTSPQPARIWPQFALERFAAAHVPRATRIRWQGGCDNAGPAAALGRRRAHRIWRARLALGREVKKSAATVNLVLAHQGATTCDPQPDVGNAGFWCIGGRRLGS